MAVVRKKLIEVALPLDAINAASISEKQPFTRKHPRSIHIWWARRPLAAARAVVFAQMVDDPSGHPERFPTAEAQDAERQRLFKLIEQLVKWENTANENLLAQAREEIWKNWRALCAENQDHPRAAQLFDPENLPDFHDPFAGGGSLPLEAQRLGLKAYASDLNPVSVLINKAMIEIPPKFASWPPVNPEASTGKGLNANSWRGAQGLAEDMLYYGTWMQNEAEKRIGHLYPKVEVTEEMARERPDLKPLVGRKLTVIAFLWARTVKSPNPAFATIDVPLVASFWLSTRKDTKSWVDAVVRPDKTGYDFEVRMEGRPAVEETINRSGGICLMSGTPIPFTYIREQARAGLMGVRLLAIVAEGRRKRVYLPPTAEMEEAAKEAKPIWKPDVEFLQQALGFRVGSYGLTTWSDLFTPRQLVALGTFCDLVQEARALVLRDALAASLPDDGKNLGTGGSGAAAYADAVAVYLALATSRWSDLSNSLCSWNNVNENVRALFARQAVPMSWDFVELSPFSRVGSWFSTIDSSAESSTRLNTSPSGFATQADAASQDLSMHKVVSTDPPYYDNVGYADLSDFFYVWLRRSLRQLLPDLFTTVSTPKEEELVATPARHGGQYGAESFFLQGMTRAMNRLAEQVHPAFPVTIYYAFKQTEANGKGPSTGWETFLEAAIHAGLALSGTWPMSTERVSRSRGLNSNALTSSIILVCRPRPSDAPTATRREFLTALKAELPIAVAHLQRSNIAPVDLAQAAIGPGMGVYTRYARVLDAEGKPFSVRDALAAINQTLDEVLADQEGDFDADTRWALAWFEQFGFAEGEYGVAETLSKAKGTSVDGMMEGGVLISRGGKVRLFRPGELPANWDPSTDRRLTVWQTVHQLVRVLEAERGGGEIAAADLVAKLGSKAEVARELAYRLYTICERKKRAPEALSYNGLVQSWPEITRLAREGGATQAAQPGMFPEV